MATFLSKIKGGELMEIYELTVHELLEKLDKKEITK